MNDVRKVLAAEWLKLKGRPSSFIVPIIVIAFSAALAEALRFAAKRQWIGEPSGFYLAAASMGWAVNVGALFSIIATSFHVSREFDLGTIKSTWVRPLSRQGWFAGKVVSAWIMTGGIFIAAVLAVAIMAGARTGFSDLIEKDYLIHSAASLSLRFVETMLLLLLSLFATATVVASIAAFCRHPGVSIAAGFGLGLLFAVLGMYPAAKPFLLSTALGAPAEQLIAMTKGLPTPLPWGTLAWRTAACAGAWLVFAFFVGSLGIRKREIKE